MTRPKAPKSKARGTSVPAATAAAQAGAAQQQGAAAAAGAQQTAAKKRPAAEATVPAAAAAVGEQPEVDQLERKRMQVADELRQVERQIFDLESNYFQISSAMGNAIRGYEGFLGAGSKKAAAPVQPDERLFSWSSVTGQVAASAGGGAD